MEPLVFGAVLLIGGLLAVVLLWIIDRIQRPARQRAETAWQLALAQQRHERRRIASGPMFARAGQHLERITERAAHALYLVEHDRKPEAVAALRDLQRHCQELTEYMKPRKRRTDPGPWRL